jgi:spermidine/putrescine transport system permease protein
MPPEKKTVKRFKPFFAGMEASPHIVWSVLFIVAPLIFVCYYAFTDGNGSFTFSNIQALGTHAHTFVLSICFSIIATTVCLLIGYPLAFAISKAPKKRQTLLLMLLMIPMWMNLLIRTYSLMAILDDGGLLNTLIKSLGMNELHIIGKSGAVIFGMVYDFLPYMVLPIYSVMSKQNEKLIEAAYDLGCHRISAHLKVTLPLSVPGIVSGITMVFVPSISTFYISQKLGGGTFELIGDTIERQFQNPNTYNVGAAISLVMMVLILISVAVMNKFSDSSDEDGGIIV